MLHGSRQEKRDEQEDQEAEEDDEASQEARQAPRERHAVIDRSLRCVRASERGEDGFFHALLESPLVWPRPWLDVEVSDEDIAVPLPSYNERADAEMNQMLDDWGIQR